MRSFTRNPERLIFIRRAWFYGGLALVSFCSCFGLAPLGSFFIWISVGMTLFFGFMSIYSGILSSEKKPLRKKRKPDPKEEELKAYIRFHIPILISVLLGGLLIVVIFLVFFR